MKKEILLRVVIDGQRIDSIIQKRGYDGSLSSSFEIIGILHKVVRDEQEKINNTLKVTNDISIKEPITEKDGDVFFLV
mgnify:CR=1 FL=1